MSDNNTKHSIFRFLRDYASIFPSVIAVMNGLLAVYSAHYPFETPTAKFAFIIIIVLLSAAAICATFYSQHLIVADRDARAAKKKYIMEQLGKFIEDGNAIKARCEDSALPVPLTDANDWKERVETFLETELGHSYVIRFRDRTGIFQSEIIDGDDAHINMWSSFYNFIVRLEQFSQKVPI
jgi:hypothetical protein